MSPAQEEHPSRKGSYVAAALASALVLAAACTGDTSADTTGDTTVAAPSSPPELDSALISEGEPLYADNCASCHGVNGEGHRGWQIRNPDGSYNPPPQDATGHTWHHPDDRLIALIRDPSPFPQSRMPPFGDTLTEHQIRAVLEYIKTWWGPRERALQWQISQQVSIAP